MVGIVNGLLALIFTTAAGSALAGAWWLTLVLLGEGKCSTRKGKDPRAMGAAAFYHGLHVVVLAFLVPAAWVVLRIVTWDFATGRGEWGVLFWATRSMREVAGLLAILWLIGTCVVIFRMRKQQRVCHYFVNMARPAAQEKQEQLDALKLAAEMKQVVELREMYGLPTALTFGWLQPVILLPAQTEPETREWMLVHELLHIKNRDVLWQSAATLMVCLHWFNPVAWYVQRQLERWSEFYCDEQVAAGKENVSVYGRLLSGQGTTQSSEAGVSKMADVDLIAERMMRLNRLLRGTSKATKSHTVLAVVVMAVVGILGAGAATSFVAQAQERWFWSTIDDKITYDIEWQEAGTTNTRVDVNVEIGEARSDSYVSVGFKAQKGSKIALSASSNFPKTAVQVGVIGPDGDGALVLVKDCLMPVLTVTESGVYRMIVRIIEK